MIGFKKVPVKSVLIAFLLSIFLIMLLYADFITDDSLPEERIEITESFNEEISEVLSYRIHEVMDGENLSIIFEEFRMPLNTAYKIFRLDKNNLLSKIKPGDEMKFTYLGEHIKSIEIAKDNINSILIEISDQISIKKISKDVELIKKAYDNKLRENYSVKYKEMLKWVYNIVKNHLNHPSNSINNLELLLDEYTSETSYNTIKRHINVLLNEAVKLGLKRNPIRELKSRS